MELDKALGVKSERRRRWYAKKDLGKFHAYMLLLSMAARLGEIDCISRVAIRRPSHSGTC